MLRDLGDIDVAELQANVSDWAYFVRVDLPAPVGTKRFTDWWSGDFTGNIDGVVATWTATDVVVGRVGQGKQGPLVVSSLDFANLNYTWTNWVNSPGLRGVAVTVYHVRLNADQSLNGAIEMYPGTIDSHKVLARAELALTPGHASWSKRILSPVPGMHVLLPAELMPSDSELEVI